MLAPPTIQIVVFAYGREPCRPLMNWLRFLERAGYDWRHAQSAAPVDVARNVEVERFLARDVPCGKEYLLMADADMVPLPEPRGRDGHPVPGTDRRSHSEGILYEPGQAVYCAYVGGDGHPGHPGDDDALGEGFCRLSAEALMATGPGWFCQNRGPHVDQVRGCEGTALSKKLWAAGYDIHCVGIVGHRKTVDLFPPTMSAAPGAPPRFRWPSASDSFPWCATAHARAHRTTGFSSAR